MNKRMNVVILLVVLSMVLISSCTSRRPAPANPSDLPELIIFPDQAAAATASVSLTFVNTATSVSTATLVSTATSVSTSTAVNTATPVSTATPVQTTAVTGLEIYASAGEYQYYTQNGYFWSVVPLYPASSVYIAYNGAPVTSAVVSMNGTAATYGGTSGIFGSYNCPYSVSSAYTCTVNYGGNTYSATVSKATGSASLSYDVAYCSFSTNASSVSFEVIQGSLRTYSAVGITTTSLIIPASAYPDVPGSYQARLYQDNKAVFSGLGPNDRGTLSAGVMHFWNYDK